MGVFGHTVVDQMGSRPNRCRPSGNKPSIASFQYADKFTMKYDIFHI